MQLKSEKFKVVVSINFSGQAFYAICLLFFA